MLQKTACPLVRSVRLVLYLLVHNDIIAADKPQYHFTDAEAA